MDLFLNAANVLIRTQTALSEKMTPEKAQLLQQAAGVLISAETVNHAAKSWAEVSDARRVILALANGEAVKPEAVADAASLCNRIAFVPPLEP